MCLLYVHVYGSMHIHLMFTEVTGGFQVSHPITLHLIPSRQSFSLSLKLGWQPASPSNVLLVPPTAPPLPTCLFPCMLYTGTRTFNLHSKRTPVYSAIFLTPLFHQFIQLLSEAMNLLRSGDILPQLIRYSAS